MCHRDGAMTQGDDFAMPIVFTTVKQFDAALSESWQ
jgi:hypothetical protein